MGLAPRLFVRHAGRTHEALVADALGRVLIGRESVGARRDLSTGSATWIWRDG